MHISYTFPTVTWASTFMPWQTKSEMLKDGLSKCNITKCLGIHKNRFSAWPYNALYLKTQQSCTLHQSELCWKVTKSDPRLDSIPYGLKRSMCCLVSWSQGAHPLTADLLKCSMIILLNKVITFNEWIRFGFIVFFCYYPNSSKN